MSLFQKLLKYRVVPLLYFLLFITIVILGICWFIRTGLLNLVRDSDALVAYFEGLGHYKYFVVFFIQLFGVIFLPATGGVVVVASAMLFGFGPTFLICAAATILGSCVSFALARYLGRPLLELFLSRRKLDKYIHTFEERKNFLLFVMFFFPFFPDDILCYVAGLVNIRWKYFLIAASLGRPWGLLLNCLVGASVFSMPKWAYVPAVLVAVVCIALSWRYGSVMEQKIIGWVNKKRKKPVTP